MRTSNSVNVFTIRILNRSLRSNPVSTVIYRQPVVTFQDRSFVTCRLGTQGSAVNGGIVIVLSRGYLPDCSPPALPQPCRACIILPPMLIQGRSYTTA